MCNNNINDINDIESNDNEKIIIDNVFVCSNEMIMK